MERHAAFLTDLLDNTRRDVTRLVYADWLEEQGHPLGELLRIQAEIARLLEDDPRVPELARREQAVLERNLSELLALRAALEPWPDAQHALDEWALELARRDPVGFRCPDCCGSNASRLHPRHPAMIHWALNPGLAVNELLLGQMVPRVLHTCRGCTEMVCSSQLVRCMACRRFHSIALWGWFRPGRYRDGLPCPFCATMVPALRNVITRGVASLGRLAARLVRRRPAH